MKFLDQIGEYLYLKKADPNQQKSSWLKKMHGINRISIFVFLLGMIIIAIKFLLKK